MAITLFNSGIINCYIFKVMIPLSVHMASKEEFAAMKNKDRNRHDEWSKFTTKIVKLESEK